MMWTLLLAVALAADAPALYQQSYDLEATGNYVGALQRVAQLEQAGQQGYMLSLRKAWLSYQAGRHTQSVEAYRAAIQAAPASLEARQGVILPLIALERWSEAEAACRDLLAKSPDDYYGLSRLAWVLYRSRRFGPAAAAYRDVLVRYPSDVDMRAGLGWSLLEGGDKSGAKSAFAEVLAVSPKNSSALAGLEALQ